MGKRNYCGYAGLMLFIVLLFSIANASMITEIILVIILFIFFALCIVNCVGIGKEGDRG